MTTETKQSVELLVTLAAVADVRLKKSQARKMLKIVETFAQRERRPEGRLSEFLSKHNRQERKIIRERMENDRNFRRQMRAAVRSGAKLEMQKLALCAISRPGMKWQKGRLQESMWTERGLTPPPKQESHAAVA